MAKMNRRFGNNYFQAIALLKTQRVTKRLQHLVRASLQKTNYASTCERESHGSICTRSNFMINQQHFYIQNK